jgi:hypothetical protein
LIWPPGCGITLLVKESFVEIASMAAVQTWKDKWKSINSKFDTCTSECITHYRSDDKCKDSIEAVVADIWNLKDWLVQDPTEHVPQADIHAFLDTKAFNTQRGLL